MDPVIQSLLQYGVLGIFTIILIWFSKDSIQRERARTTAAEAEVVRLNGIIQEKVLPAIIQATSVIGSSQLVLQNIQYQRDVERAAHGQQDKPKST